MAEASDVVRTRRLEVVDAEGNVRVVIGLLSTPSTPDSEVFGLVVKNDRGRDRVWVVTIGDGGAEVGLDFNGDTVASLAVSDFGTVDLFLG